ncbi:MAG TPA: cellulase family glycosylhydrolase [Pseudonocardiaceae bacterium]|nr:cellulase family glycosylhydrolase [Pseudonocardiaceae bacterium]
MVSRLALPILLVASLVTGASPAQAVGAPSAPPPGYLTDAQGRAIVLHGMNSSGSAKISADAMPWVGPSNIAAETDRLGSDAVRLLIFWDRVEPRPGQFDENYLNAVAQRVSWYADNGVQVILDMHQDLWGPSLSGGGNDGAPAWATFTDGQPVKMQSNWGLTYLQPGEDRAFDNFWNTTGEHPQLRQQFADAWRHVAARFAGNPGVLGYDLFNEPWDGDSSSPGFEVNQLAPFYQQVINSIRTVDGQHWILVEPQMYGTIWGWPSTLPPLSDPRSGGAHLAYAPHLYPWLIMTGQPYTGNNKVLTQAALATWQTANVTEAAQLRMPLVIGEFGGDGNEPGAGDYLNDMTTMAAGSSDGWLYWSDDPGPGGLYGRGNSWSALAGLLAQPYPRAIAGTPVHWGYDPGAHTLTVVYTDAAGVSGPTELFLPTDKFTVSCGPGCRTSWDPTRHVLSLAVPQTGGQHTITVRP